VGGCFCHDCNWAGIWPSGQSAGLTSRFDPRQGQRLDTFGCKPQCFESASAEMLCYIRTLIYCNYIDGQLLRNTRKKPKLSLKMV
jgi:hypothetical protein